MWYAITGVAGIFVGGALSYLYAAKVIADYDNAAKSIGLVFQKVAGKVTAVKKAI